MRLLGLFLENVVAIPFLRTDTALTAFLSIQNEKEWDKARSSMETTMDLFTDNTIGCVKVTRGRSSSDDDDDDGIEMTMEDSLLGGR